MACANQVCKRCEAPFHATRFWHKYCSVPCRRSDADNRWRNKRKIHLKKYYRNYYSVPKNKKRRIEAGQKHYWANRESKLAQAKKLRQTRRKLIIEKYGGFCVCCGEKRIEFLAIDHINGGGYREITSMGSQRYFQMLFKRKPDKTKYRVLCHNCNSARGFSGYCPHERENESNN